MSRPRSRMVVIGVGLCVWGFIALVGAHQPGWAAPEGAPKSNRMICGSCPEGDARTGVTSAPSVCNENDPTLVQWVPV